MDWGSVLSVEDPDFFLGKSHRIRIRSYSDMGIKKVYHILSLYRVNYQTWEYNNKYSKRAKRDSLY